MNFDTDTRDTWKDLLDTQAQRGDVYKKALDQLLLLVEDRSVTRSQLVEQARALYDRAIDDAWAKPEERKAGRR